MRKKHVSPAFRQFRAAAMLAVSAMIVAPAQSAFAQTDTEVLSNAKVIEMVTGKLPKQLIEGKVAAAQPGYDLSSEGIISLNTAKVDQTTIKAMINVSSEALRRKTAPEALVGMDEVLTNEKIIRMVSTKVPKGVITMKMELSRSAYDVSATGLVNLNSSKVPQDIIKAMMLPPPPPPKPEPVAASIPVREAKKPVDSIAKPPTKTGTAKAPAGKTTTPPVVKKKN